MSKPSKKNLPRSTKEMSKEKLLEILRKKKICNSTAVSIVEVLSEKEVDKSWMLANLNHINQSHYDDIVTERSISKYCGYPLCTSELTNVPEQQYRISLTNKTVYDITERKKFCQNACYKASEYLKAQILTSPLWFRENEPVPDFKIWEKGTLASPEEINKVAEESHEESFTVIERNPSTGRIESNESNKNVSTPERMKTEETEFCPHVKENSSANSFKRSRVDERINSNQPTEPTKRQILDPVTRLEKVFQSWFTIRTYIYLFGEEKLKEELLGHEDLINKIGNIQLTMTNTSQRYEDISKLFSLLKLDGESSDEVKELKPLPDYSILKHEADNLNIKVRAFYTGQLDVPVVTGSQSTEDGDGGLAGTMPFVDSSAQVALRRKLVLERLNRSVPELCNNLDAADLLDIREIPHLVRTFCLAPDNITFKPQELPLLSAIIVQMLSYKSRELSKHLASKSCRQRVGYLLEGYGLSPDYLESAIQELANVQTLTASLESSSS